MRVVCDKLKIINNSSSSFNDGTMSDDDSSSDGLEIDISESPSLKTEINIEDKLVLENIEEEIERQLDEKAAKSNLSATNVKNILKHVITNEHVLAMVRCTTDGSIEDGDCVYEPKFTRAKAKELLKTRCAAAIPWVKSKPKSDVHMLINEDLPEDQSDDDEYVPEGCVEEEQSEDEKENYTHSDQDSQPETPATPASTHDTSTQTNWTEDGVFKVPQSVKTAAMEDSENIALRTRSKLSLSDTPLEIIEEAFIPPDITTDMYDFECDDEDWSEFLKKFTRPLDEAHGTQEDDDEADPEYNVLADEEIDTIDKEELRQDRAVKIPKKELNTLVAELFEFSEIYTNAKEFEKATQDLEINTNQIDTTSNIFPAEIIAEPDNTVNVLPSNMSTEQKLLFDQQMRQHIQLLTQSYILTYEHPVTELQEMADTFKNMLLSFSELSKYQFLFDAYNLQMSIDFIENWEECMRSNTPEIMELKQHIKIDYEKQKSCYDRRVRDYVSTFPKLMMKKMSESIVFLYPSLLPKIPFRYFGTNARIHFLPAEDELIALGLDQFIPYMEQDKMYLTKYGKIRLRDAAYFVSKYMLPARPPSKITSHINQIQRLKLNASDNPIQYYLENKKAPTAVHYVVQLSEFGVVPPSMRPPQTLPYQWKMFLYPEPPSLPMPRIPPPKNVQKPPAYNKKPAIKEIVPIAPLHKPSSTRKAIPEQSQAILINSDGIFETEIEVKSPPVLIINKKLPITILSTHKKKQKRRPAKRRILPQIEKIYISTKDQDQYLSENTEAKHVITPQSKIVEVQDTVRLVDTDALIAHDEINLKKIPQSLLQFKFNSSVFQQFKDADMLPSMPFLLTPLKDTSAEACTSPEKSDELAGPKQLLDPVEVSEKPVKPPEKVELPETDIAVEFSDGPIEAIAQVEEIEIVECAIDTKKDDEDELNALMIASSTIQQKNRRLQANSSKKAKQLREHNATLAMLCPEEKRTTEEKAKNYAQAFYDKVQERLENTAPLEYQRFMEVLSEHDESVSSVSDLYEKIESVLSPKNPDLCEEFLTFLTPEQAKQIGKLVPHFLLSNMSLFLRKLEIYYTNQPAQLRRIYNSLTELSELPDVSMDRVKSTILPLLKGNALLSDWFLQMFPHEQPPESMMTDWEQMSCDDADVEDDDDKIVETITLPEVEDPYGGPNCICKCHQIENDMYASRARHCIPCGTKFLQGRVYVQTGKGLRLANVTFNNNPNTDHNKRLSVKPIVRPKRKSETSPSKLLMSPTKDDEPRHSNESEDDINAETNPLKKRRPFRTNSPSKSRKKLNTKSAPKIKIDCKTKKSAKTDNLLSPTSKRTKKLIKKESDMTLIDAQEELSLSLDKKCDITTDSNRIDLEIMNNEVMLTKIEEDGSKTEESESKTEESDLEIDWDVKIMETNKMEFSKIESKTESEPEWDVKSPGHSVESIDTCEESSQDTIEDGQGSESDNDSTIEEEFETVLSENSDDSDACENDPTQSWTRDEDKVILQTFQERGDSLNIFKDIQLLLMGRSVSEVKSRFQTLMSLLQEMASNIPE